MGDNMSNNPERLQDADPTTTTPTYLYTLPRGRWILPDDWPILAGPNWKEMRIYWDIMDNPFDSIQQITNLTSWGMGDYVDTAAMNALVAEYPVIGPFRPGLELPTATGYNPYIANMINPYIDQKTVVPDGDLNWWDAPMPPAKITFKMLNASVLQPVSQNRTIEIGNAGFFKDAFKTDIYYLANGAGALIAYTSPFYYQMIPAFSWIPAFVNNGGYDWDSWNSSYGPYQFWKIMNRPMNEEMPLTRPVNNSSFPSKV